MTDKVHIKFVMPPKRIMNVKLRTFSSGATYEPYDGEYIVVPSNESQTLLTAGKSMRQNIVIQPIPSCYGLIGWNGAILTVS